MTEAARVIGVTGPDVVTLNEVCSGDVVALAQALSRARRGGRVVHRFAAVMQLGSDHRPVRCRNGQQFGDGVLARLRPTDRGPAASSGRYPSQDPADTERRGWLCIHIPGRFFACTTHLANTSPAVALRQCRYFMDTALPAFRARDPSEPDIVGADLNLRDGAAPNVQSCRPPGFARAGDGGRQDVLARAMAVVSSRTVDLRGATDHPGLLVELAGPD